MQINLSKLFEQDGSHEELSVGFDADSVRFGGEKYDFVEKSPVELAIKHTRNRHIDVSGTVSLKLRMKCARCLEDVDETFDLQLESSFDMNSQSDESEETPYVSGYSLDVDLLVMDELFVNMPISVLCSEDCKGLCPKCGINLNHGSCDCDTTVLDPRMAKILDIYNAHNKEV